MSVDVSGSGRSENIEGVKTESLLMKGHSEEHQSSRPHVQNQALCFTRIERRLLWLLQRHVGQFVEMEAIVLHVWGEDYLPLDYSMRHLVRVNISRIRAKLRDHEVIESKVGFGLYRLVRAETSVA